MTEIEAIQKLTDSISNIGFFGSITLIVIIISIRIPKIIEAINNIIGNKKEKSNNNVNIEMPKKCKDELAIYLTEIEKQIGEVKMNLEEINKKIIVIETLMKRN